MTDMELMKILHYENILKRLPKPRRSNYLFKIFNDGEILYDMFVMLLNRVEY